MFDFATPHRQTIGMHWPKLDSPAPFKRMRFVCGLSLLSAAFVTQPPLVHAVLVGHWDYEGNLQDLSGFDNHGIDNGPSPITYSPGIRGQAGYFDGNAFFEAPDNPNSSLDLTTHMTIAVWLRPLGIPDETSTTPNAGIVMKQDFAGGNNFGPYELLISNEAAPHRVWTIINERTVVDGNQPEVFVDAAVNHNEWQHFAVTYDSVNLSLFKNGSLIASTPYTAPMNVEDADLIVGARWIPAAYYYGYMDDLRIYNHALSQTAIMDLVAVPEISPWIAIPVCILMCAVAEARRRLVPSRTSKCGSNRFVESTI